MKILKPVYLAACVGGLAFTTKAAGGDIEPKMLQAYSGGQYELAKKLSAQCKDSSKAKLVSALCDVYNMKNQDLSHGLQGLKRLYEDGKVTGKIRIQAGLSYARAAQTLSMRDGLTTKSKTLIMKQFILTSSRPILTVYLQFWR